jgi:hypothetical protein
MYDHLTTVSRHMNTLGWANYANDHEDANGQFAEAVLAPDWQRPPHASESLGRQLG